LTLMLEALRKLGMKLMLVQAEYCGNRHYVDERGNRVVLYADGTFAIEEASPCP